MRKIEANAIVGNGSKALSDPSKMPCHAFGIPARKTCPVGEALSKVKGSVCWLCYASAEHGGSYAWRCVQTAQQRRLEAIDHPQWIEAMVTLIRGMAYFRWHDSGDIFSDEYFEKILAVCRALPETRFWLPTKEIDRVKRYANKIPNNLTIRVSAPMIDQHRPVAGFNTSSVHSAKAPHGFECRAPKNDGKCGACRACWDSKVSNVSYKLH